MHGSGSMLSPCFSPSFMPLSSISRAYLKVEELSVGASLWLKERPRHSSPYGTDTVKKWKKQPLSQPRNSYFVKSTNEDWNQLSIKAHTVIDNLVAILVEAILPSWPGRRHCVPRQKWNQSNLWWLAREGQTKDLESPFATLRYLLARSSTTIVGPSHLQVLSP